MTLAQKYIAPWYDTARDIFGVLPPTPIYGDDYADGPNAEARLIDGIPWFAWRLGYPSPALDAATRERETRRTACHEIGHPFEKLVPGSREKFAAWRGFDWHTWEAGGRQPREFFADAFGAALSGEWITPIGSSEADRHRWELPTVTAQEARDFFLELVGRNVDYPGAIWSPSPNFWRGRPFGIAFNVCHWTTSGAASARATLTSPTSGVSAHFMIRRDTVIEQYVRVFDRAWHTGSKEDAIELAGFQSWNDVSVGYEFEHIPGQDWPEGQLRAGADLIAYFSGQYGIPRDWTVGHNETGYATQCPGDLPMDALREEELAFKDDPDAQAYVQNVRESFEAVKAVLADLATKVNAINAANDHTHEGVVSAIVKTGGPVAR